MLLLPLGILCETGGALKRTVTTIDTTISIRQFQSVHPFTFEYPSSLVLLCVVIIYSFLLKRHGHLPLRGASSTVASCEDDLFR